MFVPLHTFVYSPSSVGIGFMSPKLSVKLAPSGRWYMEGHKLLLIAQYILTIGLKCSEKMQTFIKAYSHIPSSYGWINKVNWRKEAITFLIIPKGVIFISVWDEWAWMLRRIFSLIDTNWAMYFFPNMRMSLSNAKFGSRIRKIIFINNPLNEIA